MECLLYCKNIDLRAVLQYSFQPPGAAIERWQHSAQRRRASERARIQMARKVRRFFLTVAARCKWELRTA